MNKQNSEHIEEKEASYTGEEEAVLLAEQDLEQVSGGVIDPTPLLTAAEKAAAKAAENAPRHQNNGTFMGANMPPAPSPTWAKFTTKK